MQLTGLNQQRNLFCSCTYIQKWLVRFIAI